MSDLTFRARSATEIVDGTFRLYREHFVPFLTLSTLAHLPIIALMISWMWMIGGAAENPSAIGTVFIAIPIFTFFWYPVIRGALMLSASERYLGRDIEAADAVRRARGKLGSLVASQLAKWAIFWLGLFLLIIPGFYFIVRYFAIPATVLFENRGVGESFRRSSQLSINQKGRIFGTLFLAWLILFGISVAVSMLVLTILGVAMASGGGEAMSSTSSMLLQLPSIFAYILGLPVIVITEMLLYYDVRIRQEGYDIELMSAQLEGAGTGVAAH